MANYKDIHGTKVEVRSDDPSNPVNGQVWYNSRTLKGHKLNTAGAWGSGMWDGEISWSLYDGATGGAAFALAGVAETIEINCSTPGCMDASACNFNADATEDDGSCSYAEENYDCDGS